MTTNNNIEQKKEKKKERLESSSNNTRSAQVQNRYEVCIYDKHTQKEREISPACVCVSLLVKVFSLSSAFRDTQKKKRKIN